MKTRRTRGDSNRGQAMVEAAFAIAFLALVFAGAVEYGRMINATAILAEAAREGARTAAVMDTATRSAAAKNRAQQTAASYFASTDLDVTETDGTVGTEPTVTVSVTGKLPLLFARFVPTATFVNGRYIVTATRSATLRDEVTGG